MFNRKYIFKWWMFHCHVSFRAGTSHLQKYPMLGSSSLIFRTAPISSHICITSPILTKKNVLHLLTCTFHLSYPFRFPQIHKKKLSTTSPSIPGNFQLGPFFWEGVEFVRRVNFVGWWWVGLVGWVWPLPKSQISPSGLFIDLVNQSQTLETNLLIPTICGGLYHKRLGQICNLVHLFRCL